MRLFRLSTLVCLGLLLAGPVYADTASSTPAAAAAVTWSNLSVGDDWSVQVLNSLFPFGSASGTASGTKASGLQTVVGLMLGRISAYIMLLAMTYIAYATILKIHKAAEGGKVLTASFNGWVPVRIGLALVMMVPLPSGFSLGQQTVVKTATWGVGMARDLYGVVIQSVGPQALPLSSPMIPGTQTLVAGLIENELCMDLINDASNNHQLVPTPTMIDGTAEVGAGAAGYVALVYRLAEGSALAAPTCGSVTLRSVPQLNTTKVYGVSLNMAQDQRDVLSDVLANHVRGPVKAVADAFWTTRQAASLVPLRSVMLDATGYYHSQLAAKASAIVASLRTGAAANMTQMHDGQGATSAETPGQLQMSALGWTSAGAYYLEIGRLNATVLSLATTTPSVVAPSYAGLGSSLSRDVAPLIQAALAYQEELKAMIATTDGIGVPGGPASLFDDSTASDDSDGVLDQITRHLHLDERFLNGVLSLIAPTAQSWSDPFAQMIALGHLMIATAIGVAGAAAVMSSSTLSKVAAVGSLLTGNVPAAAGLLVGNKVVTFLAIPIFMGCIALLVPGIMLAFALPAVPYAMWLAGVTGWLILVCEAVLAVPIWMLAHLAFEGEGLHGRGIAGYSLIVNIMFRPILMLAGLIMSYTVFSAMSWLLMQSFGIMASFVLQNGTVLTNLIGVIVLICMFVTMETLLAMQSFKMISSFPHHIIQLLGFQSASRSDMNEFAQGATVGGMKPVASQIAKLLPASKSSGGSGHTGQKQLSGPGQSRLSSPSHAEHETDSTLRAQTEVLPAAPEQEGE